MSLAVRGGQNSRPRALGSVRKFEDAIHSTLQHSKLQGLHFTQIPSHNLRPRDQLGIYPVLRFSVSLSLRNLVRLYFTEIRSDIRYDIALFSLRILK
jgi:hypothetical protein